MFVIKLKDDLDKLRLDIENKQRKQINFAASKAINVVAKTVQESVRREMQNKFDRPTPFTLNSTFIKYANRQKLSAMVYIKDRELAKSKSLAESIGHQFAGNRRMRKRLEYWLSRAGFISSDEYVVPGAGAKLDQYGNMSRGQIQQILSQLRAGPDAASYRSGSARSRASRAAAGYFWSRGGKLARGVYQRFNFAAGGAVKPVLIVVKAPLYRQLIDMHAIGNKVVARDFNAEFSKQLEQAMRTARWIGLTATMC